jgi:hypothetical protein
MNYLATLQRVKNLTAISNNVDSKMIDPYMRSAQVLKMQPNLGVKFQDEILAETRNRSVYCSRYGNESGYCDY